MSKRLKLAKLYNFRFYFCQCALLQNEIKLAPNFVLQRRNSPSQLLRVSQFLEKVSTLRDSLEAARRQQNVTLLVVSC